MIGRIHSKALNYDIEKDENILGHRLGSKYSVGFNKKGLMNGIGFNLLTKATRESYNPDTNRNQDEFYLRPAERGYFVNSQLNGLGEKWFKNGNIYLGDFKGDLFEGNGILKNTLKNNWVFAYFERGNMSELFDYSHEGEGKKFQKLIEGMHEKKTNWIDKDLQLVDAELFLK